MKPIFISYSSKHRDLTQALVAVIEDQYGSESVWWDHELESRSAFADQIKAALEAARVVVVIWTEGALVSDYVYAEAMGAQRQGKLVNVRPADVAFSDIPEPFNVYHIDNLDDRERILSTIAKVMTGTPIPTRVPLHEVYSRQYGRPLLDPRQGPLARDPLEISPSHLLQARFEVVGYLETSTARADLLDWCLGDTRRTAGCVIHGPGGTGKTRLLIDVAKELRQQGWMAGFLEHPHEEGESALRQRWQALDQLLAQGDDRGLLLVIDYAENRKPEIKRLTLRLAQRSDHDVRRLRLVLLGRSAGDWWTTLHDETPEVPRFFRNTATHRAVIALPTVSAVAQRRGLFDASCRGFAPYLAAQGFDLPTGEPPSERLQRIAEDDSYERPLAIQMEALLWLTSAWPQAGVTQVDDLLRQVLGLERAHWTKLIPELADDEIMRDMARAVAQVTAVRGSPSRSSLERLLMADGFYQGRRSARVAVDREVRGLLEAFGTADEGTEPLEPDLVGEHHVATVADAELIDGCLRWIDGEPADQQTGRRRSLVTVLQRATLPEHGARASGRAARLLDHLIDTHVTTLADVMVGVMIETPGALKDRVGQRLGNLAFEALLSLSDALPGGLPSLLDLSWTVAARVVDLAREDVARSTETGVLSDASLDRLAHGLYTLSLRLAALQRPEQALAAGEEAVDLFRRLSPTNDVLIGLARALLQICRLRSDLGRSIDALRANVEAFKIYEALPDPQPDHVHADLAQAAGSLGICFARLGEHEDAAGTLGESVRLYRALAHTHGDAGISLATALNNLAVGLSRLGRDEEALSASQEAVDLYRRFAATRPDAFADSLASGLDTLGNRLVRLDRAQEALAASEESVRLFRRLEEIRPDVFLPRLAKSLANLAGHLASLARHDESLAANREAMAIWRRLERARPGAFLADLALSLGSEALLFEATGRPADALAQFDEAIRTLAPRFLASPEAFEDDMLSLLREHRRFLVALGKEPDENLLGPVIDELSLLQARRRAQE